MKAYDPNGPHGLRSLIRVISDYYFSFICVDTVTFALPIPLSHISHMAIVSRDFLVYI